MIATVFLLYQTRVLEEDREEKYLWCVCVEEEQKTMMMIPRWRKGGRQREREDTDMDLAIQWAMGFGNVRSGYGYGLVCLGGPPKYWEGEDEDVGHSSDDDLQGLVEVKKRDYILPYDLASWM
jgi:hypothetical protein